MVLRASLFLPVPPLFVIEFLHRVIDIFTDYFTECTEQRIKDQYVIVYEASFFADEGRENGVYIMMAKVSFWLGASVGLGSSALQMYSLASKGQ